MKMVLDTKTTVFVPGQICQLSYIIFDEDKVIKSFNSFFKVDSVDEGAQKVHGLSVERLSTEPLFAEKLEEIKKDIEDVDKIYIHNSAFDIKFMEASGTPIPKQKEFCTMLHHVDICKLPGKYGKNKWPKLSETMEHYEICPDAMLELTKSVFKCEDTGFHDSRYDVTCLMMIVRKMEGK
jgi:DNA polymerase III epsilon subunit-like protein